MFYPLTLKPRSGVKRVIIDNNLQCAKCFGWFPSTCFYARPTRKYSTTGFDSYCKRCIKRNYDCISNLITNSRRRAKKKGHPHELNRTFILDLLKKQDGRCALTGILLNIKTDPRYFGQRRAPPDRMSIDRIDNSKGYTKNNVQLVCDFVNRFRNFLDISEFVSFCTLVAENHKRNPSI